MLHINVTRTFISFVLYLLILSRLNVDVIAAPVISGMEIISGTRGMILSLSADTKFTCEVKSVAQQKVHVFIPGGIYGLSGFSFSKFSKDAPLSSINAKERSDGSGIELLLTLKSEPSVPFVQRSKGNQQLILLSKHRASEFSWKADPITSRKKTEKKVVKKNVSIPEKEQAPVVNAGTTVNSDKADNEIASIAKLKDIKMLQRGNVCKLEFEFDSFVTGGVRRNGNSLIIVFENAKNTIGKSQFTIKPGMVYQKIYISDSKKNDEKMTATIRLDTSVSDMSYNVAYQDKKVLSIYILHKDKQRTALWTATSGTQWDHEFSVIPYRNIDLKVLGERAKRDALVNITSGPVFRIGEQTLSDAGSKLADTQDKTNEKLAGTPVQTEKSKAASVEKNTTVQNEAKKPVDELAGQSGDAVVFVTNNVNIRALPSMNGKVIGKGTVELEAYRIGKDKDWTKISVNGKVGWVSSRLLKVPEKTDIILAGKNNGDEFKDKINKITVPKTTMLTSGNSDSMVIQKVSQIRVDNKDEAIKKEQPDDALVKYVARGRDPFKPLVNELMGQGEDPGVDQLSLVGLLIDGREKLALFEDKSNQRRPITLRENDRVEHGKVLKIYQDKVVFLLTEYGISRSYTMRLFGVESDQEVRVR